MWNIRRNTAFALTKIWIRKLNQKIEEMSVKMYLFILDPYYHYFTTMKNLNFALIECLCMKCFVKINKNALKIKFQIIKNQQQQQAPMRNKWNATSIDLLSSSLISRISLSFFSLISFSYSCFSYVFRLYVLYNNMCSVRLSFLSIYCSVFGFDLFLLFCSSRKNPFII